MEHPLTDDMELDGTEIVDVKNYKLAFDPLVKAINGISEFRGVIFSRGLLPKVRTAMTSSCTTEISILKRGKHITSLTSAELFPAYTSFLPIKAKNYDDVKALLSHVHLPQHVSFYSNLRPTDEPADEPDDVE